MTISGKDRSKAVKYWDRKWSVLVEKSCLTSLWICRSISADYGHVKEKRLTSRNSMMSGSFAN